MKIILLAILLVAIAFAGIAIKLLVKKDGRFEGTCSSNNPLLKNGDESCGICGARPGQSCKETPANP